MGCVHVQGLMQNIACATGAPSAAGADAELLAQFLKGSASARDGAADVALCDRIADADVHGVFLSIW